MQSPCIVPQYRLDLGQLLELVRTTKWYELGLQLHVPPEDLSVIEQDTRLDNDGGRRRMFQAWLRCQDATPELLASALYIIGEKRLANDVRQRYNVH